MRRFAHKFLILSGVLLFWCVKVDPSRAQVIEDGTLSTDVNSSDNLNFVITGGSRPGNGGNLFHSFQDFSVPAGGSAFFDNPKGIQNIISRVTGDSISNIQGLIGAKYKANLFLINPNGIIFGPGAELQIGGSFIATSAEQIDFVDGTSFRAERTQSEPLLTISMPIGLRFGDKAGSIANQSAMLTVKPGKTIALIGRGVFLEGSQLTAPAGRIEIGSIAGAGSVSVSPAPGGWTFGYEDIQTFGDIQLVASYIVTSGEGGGAIHLWGKNIILDEGSFVISETKGRKKGKDILINASESVQVKGCGLGFCSSILSRTSGNGKAGDIKIVTKKLSLSDRGEISANSESSGAGGNLTVQAAESVEVINGGLFTRAIGEGDAGNLTINTGNLTLRKGGQISTSTFDKGDAGDLAINSESVEVSGSSPVDSASSGLFSQTSGNTAKGDAGLVEINTKRLSVYNGGVVSVGTVDGSSGQGGELRINASESVEVDGTAKDDNFPSSLLAVSDGVGAAGNLRIVTNKFTVRNGAEVTVSASGSGAAGNLDINARDILLDNGGFLKAETAGGEGNISIQARNIFLSGNSGISTNATGEASGGDIKINTGVLVAVEDSDITANSQGSFGGNVNITAARIFRSLDSDITATSTAGPQFNGTVNIDATATDPNQGLVELPTTVVDPDALVAQNACKRGSESEFTSSGRGGLPANPNQDLSNGLAPVGLVEPTSTETSGKAQNQPQIISANPQPASAKTIAPAQGWVYNEKGEIVLVAYNPNITSLQRLKDSTACAGQ